MKMSDNILSRYGEAQKILSGYLSDNLVMNDAIYPHWVISAESDGSHCFWYIRNIENGIEFRLVDARSASNEIAFDHQALADHLEEATGKAIDPHNLPITDVSMTLSPLLIRFQCGGKSWVFDTTNGAIDDTSDDGDVGSHILSSPDATKEVFVVDNNLWVRDCQSGNKFSITEDGTEDFSYGGSLLNIDKKIQARWSPDSKYLFVTQLDSRDVTGQASISYAPYGGGLRPETIHSKMACAGDDKINTYKLSVIEVATGHAHTLDNCIQPFVLNGPETFDGFFTSNMGWWSTDSQRVFFIDVKRGLKRVRLIEWNIIDGSTKVIFEESSDTYLSLRADIASSVVFLPLLESDELVWYSERNGWAHLYLYDLNAGKLKNQITEGGWLVRSVLHYDSVSRELIIQTAGRDFEVNPYYRDICRVNIDTGKLIPIASGSFDHMVYSPSHGYSMQLCGFFKIDTADSVSGTSPCGKYVVATVSRVDKVPETLLYDSSGNLLLTIEVANISKLPSDWCWPEPVQLKAADERTDIYGVVFRPPGFSSDKSYPVVDYVSGFRSLDVIPFGSFNNSHFQYYFEMAALAALGFIVVGITGRGTPLRNKAFQDHNYGKPGGEDDLEDHIAGLHQLKKRYPYIDLDHVGITSMECASNVVYGALKYSDFYKVAVSHCFSDPRHTMFPLEMYHNIYDQDSLHNAGGPEDHVESFNGKLLLICGMLAGAESTFRLVEALQAANKDFDMLCLPNIGYKVTNYTRRRGWDYLVKHLLGYTPPNQFRLAATIDTLVEDWLASNPS